MGSNVYYEFCKKCEHLYHCHGREKAEKICNEESDIYLIPGGCENFYPERIQ